MTKKIQSALLALLATTMLFAVSAGITLFRRSRLPVARPRLANG